VVMSRMVDGDGQDLQCMYKRNIGAHSHNFWCHRIAISVTNSECMSVALDIQHGKCMNRITVSSVVCLVGCTIFLHILINYVTFGEKLLNVKYIF
jgi:hypothetical protein